MVTSVCSNKLILESRDKCTGTKCKCVVSSFTAVKCNTINKSFEIDCCDIAVCSCTILNCNCSCILILLFLNLSVNFLVCYSNLRLRNLYTLVISKSNLWFHSYISCEDKSFTWLHLCNIDLRLGNDLKIALAKSFCILLWYKRINSVFHEYTLAIHALDHLSRSFSFTESWKADSAFLFLVSFLHCFV